MADYIYLLENRLSEKQKSALSAVREVARAKGATLFLVGGAVRDLTCGSPVRDLDVVVQGSALKWKKELELAGGVVLGTSDSMQAVFTRFPGGVRMEVGSTLSVTYPKPGKPVVKASTILDDLRRRDFTANAMALSLNDGSYGLLMDPLNGVADIENREIRLASNYGFIEDPVRMIRAVRFAARLGWELEEKTKARYETGKEEGYIRALDDHRRGYEAEEIVHEEDPLRVMRRLEAEGWMQVLVPGWTTAKANLAELEKVREAQTQLQMQGIHPDASAINFPLLTAKMSVKEVAALKKSFLRQGFVAEIEALEGEAKDFATALGARSAAVPSVAYRMIVAAKPEALLYVLYSSKSSPLQAKIKSFMTDWPQARQKIPYALMQEMRITPEIAGYADLVEKLFFELMDGKLGTPEEMKAFLEPYSPPAPPPPVHIRRARATKKDKGKGKGKKGEAIEPEIEVDDEEGDAGGEDGDETPRGVEEDEEAEDAAEEFDAVAELGGAASARQDEDEEDDEEEDDEPAAVRKAAPSKKSASSAASIVQEFSTPMPSPVEPVVQAAELEQGEIVEAQPPAASTGKKKASDAPTAAKVAPTGSGPEVSSSKGRRADRSTDRLKEEQAPAVAKTAEGKMAAKPIPGKVASKAPTAKGAALKMPGKAVAAKAPAKVAGGTKSAPIVAGKAAVPSKATKIAVKKAPTRGR